MKQRLSLLLFPLILASLACKTVMGGWQPTPSAISTHPPIAQATRTFTPLPPTLPPTFTPPPPTLTPTETLPSTSAPGDLDSQRQVFEELWQIIDEKYLYSDFNGVNWQAVHEEYRQKIEAGLSEADFYQAMRDMVTLLNDEHSTFLSPEDAQAVDAEYAGSYDYVGIGILTIAVPDRQRITLIAIFPGSPAEQAGLKLHDSILTVDSQPILDENGFRQNLLRGPENTPVTLTVQTPGQEPRQMTIIRRRVTGALPIFHQVLTSPSGKRIGYILLVTFQDSTVEDQVRHALEEMSAGAPLDGLIIDNRPNSGGSSDVFEGVLSFFAKGNLGDFVSRPETRPLRLKAQNIANSQNLPLVVLVGRGTASFAEIFSGILKDIGRATIVGALTDGNVEILHVYNFSDGSRAWIAAETFRPLKHPNQDWEQTGIAPDISVESNWDEVTISSDPTIQAALEHFDP